MSNILNRVTCINSGHYVDTIHYIEFRIKWPEQKALLYYQC